MHLRAWQQRAKDKFYAKNSRDFLVSATPGAGKTKFALHMATSLMEQGAIQRVIVIVPTDALREQWADEASTAGLNLKPVAGNEDYDKAGYQGCVATYQQLLGAGADSARRVTRRPTLAILDEIHHAGEQKSWGDSLMRAMLDCRYRLALTGTPWRRDNRSPIPFVDYDVNGKVMVDYGYEYGEAVVDEVCRRIEFHAYDGEARWTDPSRANKGRKPGDGDNGISVEFTAKLGANMAEEDVSAALDVVYEPKYRWMPAIIAQANRMLTDLRVDVPDAAGLIVAERQWHAHGYAAIIEQMTGTRPPVVVSDPKTDPGSIKAKDTIEKFREGKDPWIVAVKMISEGVDIPRLAVGIYASKTQTPLFFRQVVGRFVRTRSGEELNACLLIPAVPELMRHAREIEEELRHQLDLAEAADRANLEAASSSTTQTQLNFRMSVSASEPVFDRAIMGGDECTPEEVAAAERYCRDSGVPTRWAVNLVPLIRAQAGSSAPPAAGVRLSEGASAPTSRHRLEKRYRDEIKSAVNRIAYRRGVEPREVNTEVLRAGYPQRKSASLDELEAILVFVKKLLVEEAQ